MVLGKILWWIFLICFQLLRVKTLKCLLLFSICWGKMSAEGSFCPVFYGWYAVKVPTVWEIKNYYLSSLSPVFFICKHNFILYFFKVLWVDNHDVIFLENERSMQFWCAYYRWLQVLVALPLVTIKAATISYMFYMNV